MSDIHELKADPTPFEDVYSGRKMAEVRFDDRGYKVGDVLHLREHQRSGLVGGKYTGRELRRRITHIQRGYGLPEGVVVLSLESRPTPEQSRETRDVAMFRWLLDGNGYFMEEHCLCGHAPCSDEEKEEARKEIRAAMDRSALGRDG